MRYPQLHFVIGCTLSSALVLLGGCASERAAHENLSAGFASLQNAPAEDDQLADSLARADVQLAKQSTGPAAAEALYLRGRALEKRAKRTAAQASADLSAARQAYIEALAQNPGGALETNIRASLGNVCYWQDDYAAAQQQWSVVQGKFLDEATNAFLLYRLGLCQQRLGNFVAADQTFAAVAEKYPTTEAAQRAKMHSNYRGFTVQLATFANPKSADTAVAQLARDAVNPKATADAAGRRVVTIGPAQTYAQAQQLKNRYAAQYPDAVIIP